MKIAYFDCFSGISGDMILGALIDAGFPEKALRQELAKIPLPSYKLEIKKVEKEGIGATSVKVYPQEKSIIRTWSNIKTLFEKSKLSVKIRSKSLEIFLLLAQAEAQIHQLNLDQVHFHEIGAIDTIIDIVGALSGINYLKIDEIFSSPLPTGLGMVRTDHGMIPIPSPAVLEILKGVPLYSRGITAELVTPTGAAIIKSLAKSFGEIPEMMLEKVGYGAGTRDLEIPNVLRVVIGEKAAKGKEEVLQIETNIDDTNPEFFSHLVEKLFRLGALDVWLSPIYMKKNRPGTMLSLLTLKGREEEILDAIFNETNTFGVRITPALRSKLDADTLSVETIYGNARVKIGRLKGEIVTISPEYEDCAELAQKANVPLKLVYEEVKKAVEKLLEKNNL